MSLRQYLQLVRDGRWLLCAGLVVGALAGLIFALTSVPSYVATTTLYFAAIEGGGEPGQAYQGAMLAEQKARAYSELIVSDRVLDEVSFDTGGTVAPGSVTVQSTAGNPTLVVKVTDSSPQRAAAVANALADKSSDLVSELERPRDPRLSTVVTVRILAPADVPSAPASPNTKLDVVVGALLGVLIGFTAALVRRNLDRSVRTRQSLETLTELPLLGALPYERESRRAPRLITAAPRGHVAEAVRQLRVNLRAAGTGADCKTLLVTSAQEGEGKSSLACQLAAAFALEGDRVLVIDANLRRPRVADYLGVAPTAGLSTVLRGDAEALEAIESWEDGSFDVLVSGPSPDNPTELLSSERFRSMLTTLAGRYDVVLIDAPALLPVADARVLARASDAALLAVHYGRTAESDVADALAALRVVSARVLGCVFTMEPTRHRALRSVTDGPQVAPPASAASADADHSAPAEHSVPRHESHEETPTAADPLRVGGFQ
jgi:capsular exopolysaccharide synthesis family protein